MQAKLEASEKEIQKAIEIARKMQPAMEKGLQEIPYRGPYSKPEHRYKYRRFFVPTYLIPIEDDKPSYPADWDM